MADTDMTVLRCHHCGGAPERSWCNGCHGTGSIFWVNGRSYPYTPAGEKYAKAAYLKDEIT